MLHLCVQSKKNLQKNVYYSTTMILKILKKVCSIYPEEGYKAAKQDMANSEKDAVLHVPGVFVHLCRRK